MNSKNRASFLLASLAILQLMSGCSRTDTASTTLTLATTTSTHESGLLDALLPMFREQTGIDVHVVAVGSGQALELGRRGDADVLLTHAPAAEQKFMDEGWGAERRAVMYNDFVLVGPKSDRAGVTRSTLKTPSPLRGGSGRGLPGTASLSLEMASSRASIVESFARIADEAAPFVSRGDESGTHQKEKEIWQKAGRDPTGDWYIRAGAGMSQALRMADEKQAYTLSDRATYLTIQSELDLVIQVQRDPMLQNNYAVLLVSAEKHPHVKAAPALRFADFLTSPATQKPIGEFGVAKFGEPLFFPQNAPSPSGRGPG